MTAHNPEPAATHVMAPIPLGAASPSLAFWFIALTLVTTWGMLASLGHSLACSRC